MWWKDKGLDLPATEPQVLCLSAMGPQKDCLVWTQNPQQRTQVPGIISRAYEVHIKIIFPNPPWCSGKKNRRSICKYFARRKHQLSWFFMADSSYCGRGNLQARLGEINLSTSTLIQIWENAEANCSKSWLEGTQEAIKFNAHPIREET